MDYLKLILPVILLTACGNYEEFKQDPAASFTRSFQTNRQLSFVEVQRDVIGPKCLKCHANYNDYAVVSGKLTEIQNSIVSDSMPKDGPLSDEEKGIILSWIASGAPEGEVVQQPIQEKKGLVPTYDSIARNIFANKCTACHSPDGQVPFVDLSTRLSIFKQRDFLLNFDSPEESYILEVIQDPDEPMPPPGSSFEPVTEEEIRILTEWIGQGLP